MSNHEVDTSLRQRAHFLERQRGTVTHFRGDIVTFAKVTGAVGVVGALLSIAAPLSLKDIINKKAAKIAGKKQEEREDLEEQQGQETGFTKNRSKI